MIFFCVFYNDMYFQLLINYYGWYNKGFLGVCITIMLWSNHSYREDFTYHDITVTPFFTPNLMHIACRFCRPSNIPVSLHWYESICWKKLIATYHLLLVFFVLTHGVDFPCVCHAFIICCWFPFLHMGISPYIHTRLSNSRLNRVLLTNPFFANLCL